MAPAGAAATMAAGPRRNTGRRLAGLENPVASHHHSPDRLAGFRVLGKRAFLHALLDLVVADFPPIFRGDGLVNVGRHDFSNLSVLVRRRQQEGFPFTKGRNCVSVANVGCGHEFADFQTLSEEPKPSQP